MPKVNTKFFECPECGNIRFRVREYSIFIPDVEDKTVPGLIYRTEIVYSCTRCGHEVAKEEHE